MNSSCLRRIIKRFKLYVRVSKLGLSSISDFPETGNTGSLQFMNSLVNTIGQQLALSQVLSAIQPTPDKF